LETTLTSPDRPQLLAERSPAVLRGFVRVACNHKAATLGVAISAWLIAVVTGWLLLERHENRPGDLSAPPHNWPADSRLDRQANQPMLLIFAHPHCPCTRATLSELERFLARNLDSQQVTVVFTKPPGTPAGWEEGGNLRRAKAIPGVTTIVDVDGVESRRFHAITSGMVALYDAGGQLAFYGGITSSRGHEGGSDGLAALQAIIAGKRPAVDHSNVYGCPLGTTTTEPCAKDGECRVNP
jgi:hypothetical protein